MWRHSFTAICEQHKQWSKVYKSYESIFQSFCKNPFKMVDVNLDDCLLDTSVIGMLILGTWDA